MSDESKNTGYFEPERNEEQPRQLTGRVTRYRSVTTAYGELLLIHVEDDEGKEWSRRINSAALTNRVAEARPLPGERITLTYSGMTEVQGGKYAGKSCHVWNLMVHGRAPAVPDFDDLSRGAITMRHQPAELPEPEVGPEPGLDDIPF